jgi:hypothetical protein
VGSRSGCDTNPLDAGSEGDRLTLKSFVWADQTARLRLLDGALRVAQQVPASVDTADAPRWLERRLEDARPGVATVVTHSIVLQYLGLERRARLIDALRRAGERATQQAPLAWLRMEPAGDHAEVHLTTWPGGRERLVARSGFHGNAVEWLG